MVRLWVEHSNGERIAKGLHGHSFSKVQRGSARPRIAYKGIGLLLWEYGGFGRAGAGDSPTSRRGLC
jgi:hypothetical protein